MTDSFGIETPDVWTDYDACNPHHSWVEPGSFIDVGSSNLIGEFAILVVDRKPFAPEKSYNVKITIENPNLVTLGAIW